MGGFAIDCGAAIESFLGLPRFFGTENNYNYCREKTYLWALKLGQGFWLQKVRD
jgi:hypothetical protein